MASTDKPMLTFREVNEKLKLPNTILIDVRGKDEQKTEGKIPGAQCVPLDEVEAAFKLDNATFKTKYGFDKPDPKTHLIFHCKMGGRATKAANCVTSLGFNNCQVYSGFQDWTKNGGTVEK